MSKLLQKQFTFTRLVASLIEFAYREGFTLTFGDAYRSKEEAKRLSKLGLGIINSLHCQRLAVDLNLFKEDLWIQDGKGFQALGEYWESLSTPGIVCRWGGRFARKDFNHFEIVN